MLTELEAIVGERVQQSAMKHPLGNDAPYVVYPHSEQEVIHLLSKAYEKGWKVIPMGGGTKQGFGGEADQADLVICLSEWRGVKEHSVGDMTLTVQPGTTIADINQHLARENQMLPLDPFWPTQATIGGVIAANDSGPKRLRYGSVRDHVIGLRMVYPDGRLIRAVGKVVKNVAGYDMKKLFLGSMGTLGIMTEVTLKLRPMPKSTSLVVLHFPHKETESLKGFVKELLDTQLEPQAVEVLNARMNDRLHEHAKDHQHESMQEQPLTGRQDLHLVIAFEDVPKAVQYQVEWVQTHRPAGTEMNIFSEKEADQWWHTFAALPPHTFEVMENGAFDICLKLSSKNMDVIDLVLDCEAIAQDHDVYIMSHGGCGHGISKVYLKGKREQLLLCVRQIRTATEKRGGYAVLQHAPIDVRKEIPVWGDKPAYFPLLEGIKKSIDPHDLLNHKRFVGGL